VIAPWRLGLALLGLGLLAAACGGPRVPATAAGRPPAEALERLAWLAGDWRRLDSPRPRGELWWRDGTELRGEAWFEEDQRRLREQRFAIRVEGPDVVFVAEPRASGQPFVRYRLVEQERRAAVFENRGDARLQRIVYRLGPASLDVELHPRAGSGGPGPASAVERLRLVRVD
jgi:hypothetical protein